MGPRRLLQIIWKGLLSIKLVDATKLPAGIEYATLSHCWGGILDMKLTSHTAERLRGGIPISDLPTTFRDAASVTAQLGLEFLWIDALCIKQDSKDDWLIEAPKMATVYSQAYVNLAATAAANSNEGLFCQRPDFMTDVHELPISWTNVPSQCQELLVMPWNTWRRTINAGILNTRGWVYQERVLAPRTIHFAVDKVWWQCCESMSSEALVPEVGGSGEDFRLDPYSAVRDQSWAHIIINYSALTLSVQDDKLIAIAGIARFFGRYHGFNENEYLAGMWKSSIAEHMLWLTMDLKPRAVVARAPSWSWISLDSAVDVFYLGRKSKTLWTMLEADIVHHGHDRFTNAHCSRRPAETSMCHVSL